MDLLALLFVLGICGSLASGNGVKSAPEDLDGSGDDEDYSGSGIGSSFDSKDGNVISTQVSLLLPTTTQVSTALNPDIAVEPEEENVTQQTQTTKPHDPIEDIFALDPVVKEPFSEESTTLEPTTFHVSTVESVDDVKKHHHHHHHPNHHTTAPVTTHPPEFVAEETTTSLAEAEMPFVAPEETTTSTPDKAVDVEHFYEVSQKPDLVQPVDDPETTSGLPSTPYAENDETTEDPNDMDEVPLFVDSVENVTLTDEAYIHKHHHHSHTTTVPPGGSDILFEGAFEPEEDQDQQAQSTTTPSSEDKHHDHKHHHHKHHHHHTTTPEATQSTVPGHVTGRTQEPKGRRINVPPAESTTVIPVLSEEEEPVGPAMQYPVPDEDSSDSSEEESGNGPAPIDVIDDMFFEATVPVNKADMDNIDMDRNGPVPGDGNAGASHGIMQRTELLVGIIAGGLAGLVFAATLVAFVFYRMKKKDEGSYSLEEPKQSNGGYQKPREQREFYA